MNVNKDEEVIADAICEYANKYEIKEMLQEYMKRLIVERPKEPIKYLIKSITESPYIIKNTATDTPIVNNTDKNTNATATGDMIIEEPSN